MFDITASIVTFKTDKDALNKAIESFLNSGLSVRLYIIDNSPTDILREICGRKNVEYIFNNANLGFGKAHNIAIKKVMDNSKYHLVLNPDIFFKNGALEKIYGFMEANVQIGLLMPRICYFDGANQYLCKLLPAPLDLIGRRLNLKILNKRLARYELKSSGYDKIMDVPHLSGCFMFIRSEVFKKIGLFDENFFMYMEDIDLSRRIHKAYRTVYYPEVTVYHGHQRGSYKSFALLRYHVISAIQYFNKWGWLFDNERARVNNDTIANLNKAFGMP